MPRSLRPLARSAAPLALAVGALLGAACGGSSDVSKSTFEEDLQERTTIPAEVAGCITDRVYDEFDQDDVNDIYQAPSDAELRDELGEDAYASLNDINQECFTESSESGGEG